MFVEVGKIATLGSSLDGSAVGGVGVGDGGEGVAVIVAVSVGAGVSVLDGTGVAVIVGDEVGTWVAVETAAVDVARVFSATSKGMLSVALSVLPSSAAVDGLSAKINATTKSMPTSEKVRQPIPPGKLFRDRGR